MGISHKTSLFSNFKEFSIIFVLFITISSVFPPLRTIGNNSILCASFLMIWLLISFIQKPSFFLVMPKRRFIAFSFAIYTFVVPYLMGNGIIGNRYLSLSFISFGYIIYEYYKSSGKSKLIGTLIKLTLPFAFVTTFLTAMKLVENPFLSRSIQSTGEYSLALQRQGIGGYELVYFLVFIGIIILFISFISRRILFKTLLFTTFLLIFFVVILSNYLTAVIVLILSSTTLIILYFSHKTNAIPLIGFWVGVSAFLVLTGRSFADSLINTYLDFYGSGRVGIILSNVRDSLISGMSNEFLVDRWPTLISSILTTIQYPFFGLISTSIGNDNRFFERFGQHSFFLDTFALFGVFIGCIQIYLVLVPFNQNRFTGIKKVCSFPILIATLSIFLFNNATVSTAFAISIIFPYIVDNIELFSLRKNIES